MAKVILNTINRVEGSLKVELDIQNNKVVDAKCCAYNYRGIEEIVKDRDVRDVMYFTSRISGISSFSHGMAASKAFNKVFGLLDTKNTRLLKNLLQGAAFLHSHITHFYQRALLDYLRGNGQAPFAGTKSGDYRFTPQQENQLINNYFTALDMAREAMDIIAIFGGKYPHTSALAPGGFSEHIDAQKIITLKTKLSRIQEFIINKYVPDVKLLAQGYSDGAQLGVGIKQFLSFGCFSMDNDFKDQGVKLFARGLYKNNTNSDFFLEDVKEDIKYSFYTGEAALIEAMPQHKITNKKDNAYSWVKSPRYQGEAFEVGPLARMMISNPKTSNGANFTSLGSGIISVNGRHLARAEESLLIAKAMQEWIEKLNPDRIVAVPFQTASTGIGEGLTESPQGALGHWIKTNGKNIIGYNIVDPSTWNISPMDDRGNHGPIEKALIGTTIKNLAQPIEISRIIHSFDPNITAAVH